MSSAYFGISSSFRCAAPRSSVICSMPRWAASRMAPPGVSYMPRDFMPTKRFSTRSSRRLPGVVGARIDVIGHFQRRILQHLAFAGGVEEIRIDRERRLVALVLGD